MKKGEEPLRSFGDLMQFFSSSASGEENRKQKSVESTPKAGAADKPPAGPPPENEPAPEQPAPQQPAAQQPAAEQPAPVQPAAEQPDSRPDGEHQPTAEGSLSGDASSTADAAASDSHPQPEPERKPADAESGKPG